MRSHPWFLWRRQTSTAPVGNPGDYRYLMPWFRHSYTNIVQGKLCIGTITMSVPGMSVALSKPSASIAMTVPSATIQFEDCE